MHLLTSDHVRLEARWDSAPHPQRVAVLCHPNPAQAGSMRAPLMRLLASHLARMGWAVLRFNFRGVGESTGVSGRGESEVEDVAAAMTAASATYPNLLLGIAGWSFGALVALCWLARDRSPVPYVGIALPAGYIEMALPGKEALPASPKLFIVGERDRQVSVEALRSYVEEIEAELVVFPGSDHFFLLRDERLAQAVAEGLSAE